MTDLDKLKHLLKHWMEHNDAHVNTYEEWAQKAEAMGENDPGGFDLPDDKTLEAALLQVDEKPKRRGFIIFFFDIATLTAIVGSIF